MSRKIPNKIQKAIERGDLIPYKKIFNSYSKADQSRILKRARYIMIAMELRKLRKKLKLSQEALSKKMNVKREFISRIESGKQNVTLDTLYKIASATNRKLEFSFN
jgi:DNA-binding XRE family transcriptional regulator